MAGCETPGVERVKVTFPLTPALSLGEGESYPVPRRIRNLRLHTSAGDGAPSPWGWGEGERESDSALTSIVACYRCSPFTCSLIKPKNV